ncbi:MAG: ethylbenzene dehydrogenase-related protein [Gaiellales bacterium]
MTTELTRKDLLTAAGTVGVVGVGGVGVAGLIGLTDGPEPAAEPVIEVARSRVTLPVAEPGSDAWNDAPESIVPLLAQRVAPPYLDAVGASELSVRALTDGGNLALRLSWEDASVDDLDGVRRYHDAVAVMLPTRAGKAPAITMGAGGEAVHILQWRATWQRDLAGKSGVDQIYPRVVHDVMPDDILPPATAARYWVGRAAGNPLSQAKRTTPIEQIVAEGFGTTTHLRRDDANGRGEHDGKRWAVSLGFPVARDGIGEPIGADGDWSVAFAVWLGQRLNRGGRKHYATWVPLRWTTG